MQSKCNEIVDDGRMSSGAKIHHETETSKVSAVEVSTNDVDDTSMQCSPEIIAHPHYALIQEVDRVIRARFPYGAFNRVDTAAAQQLSFLEIDRYFAINRAYSQESDNENKRDIQKLADITQSMVLHDCGMSTNYAMGYLKNKYPEVNVQVIFLKTHQMLLIGGQASLSSTNTSINTDRLSLEQIKNKISEWGPDAIICDLWAARSYFAREFLLEKQKDTIIFNKAIVCNNRVEKLIPVDGHYLDGNIDIYTGAANQAYDQMLMEWVIEDQRRFNLPKCVAPQTPSAIHTPIKSAELIPILTQLSKCEGWKYHSKQNAAWLEFETAKQAERAAKSLEYTKAMVVRIGRNPANGKSMVRCEYFDLSQLKRLSDSLLVQTCLDINSLLRSMVL